LSGGAAAAASVVDDFAALVCGQGAGCDKRQEKERGRHYVRRGGRMLGLES
jgi:hypothetical protein